MEIVCGSSTILGKVTSYLERYPSHLRRMMQDERIKILVLNTNQTYGEVSPLLKEYGCDAWPRPPAGLFIVPERKLVLRSVSAMTVVHELGHALDCALGRGVYLSSSDSAIRRAYLRATEYVTPYAASAIDEYFAESVRAYLGVNDTYSLWPDVSPDKLKKCSPDMYEILDGIFHG